MERRDFLPILTAFSLILLSSTITAQSNYSDIDSFLKTNLGEDFLNNYVGEPIVNPVIDEGWDGYDMEGAKSFLGKSELSPVKEILIYPVIIDGTESSFRVIVFQENLFYSELTHAPSNLISKDEAVSIAVREGIRKPYNVILTSNDNSFSWHIITEKDSGSIDEGETTQVTIDLNTGAVNSEEYKPIEYSENNLHVYVLISLVIILVLAIIYFKRRRKHE